MSPEGWQAYLEKIKTEDDPSGGYAAIRGQGPSYNFYGPDGDSGSIYKTGQEETKYLTGELFPTNTNLVESMSEIPRMSSHRPRWGGYQETYGYGQGGDYGQGSMSETHTADAATSAPMSLYGGWNVNTAMPSFYGAESFGAGGGEASWYMPHVGGTTPGSDISHARKFEDIVVSPVLEPPSQTY